MGSMTPAALAASRLDPPRPFGANVYFILGNDH